MGSQEFVTLIKLIIRPITIGRGCWATPKHLSFAEGERRLIVNEAIRDGITKASDKHQLNKRRIYRWARRLGLEIPWQRFNTQEKRAILQEAIRNGTGVTCRAYKIVPGTLRYWRRNLGTVEP
jgi:hypothetical protein